MISCRGSAKFLYSYIAENLIPSVWCHPKWTSFPTSIHSQQSLTDSLPGQFNLDETSMRLFPGDSSLCQIYMAHHYNYLIFLFVHLWDFFVIIVNLKNFSLSFLPLNPPIHSFLRSFKFMAFFH